MSTCAEKLRAALAGLIAFALLFGPCLSINGFTGSGAAHAHAAQVSGSHDHWMPGHVGHGSMDASLFNGDDGHDAPPGCEEMCNGWAIQKSKQDLLKAAIPAPACSGAGDDGPAAILISHESATGPPYLHRSPGVTVAQDAWLSGVRSYALTGRYRL